MDTTDRTFWIIFGIGWLILAPLVIYVYIDYRKMFTGYSVKPRKSLITKWREWCKANRKQQQSENNNKINNH